MAVNVKQNVIGILLIFIVLKVLSSRYADKNRPKPPESVRRLSCFQHRFPSLQYTKVRKIRDRTNTSYKTLKSYPLRRGISCSFSTIKKSRPDFSGRD